MDIDGILTPFLEILNIILTSNGPLGESDMNASIFVPALMGLLSCLACSVWSPPDEPPEPILPPLSVMNTDGMDITQVTFASSVMDRSVSWSRFLKL